LETVLIILISISIALFILSFFQKDRTKQLEKEFEEFTLSVIQEQYQMKKRLKVLEEELLIQEETSSFRAVPKKRPQVHEVVKNQVLALHRQGLSLDQIAKQSALSLQEVYQIIESHR
jgi:hypothetical protein